MCTFYRYDLFGEGPILRIVVTVQSSGLRGINQEYRVVQGQELGSL